MSSTFSRWRKVELLDLADKLHISGIPGSIRKNDLISVIESHLTRLGEPLDVDVEYPELKSFYDSVVKSAEESSDVETESQIDDLENDVQLDIEAVLDSESADNFNDLNLTQESETQTESDAEGNETETEGEPFRFNFQNYLSDIKDNVMSANDAAQEFLSTTKTIETLFGSIELYYITKPLIESQNRGLSFSTLVTWLSFSYFLPVIFGYYINFCRYDFTIKVDPMIYYLTKGLLSLTISNLNVDSFAQSYATTVLNFNLISGLSLNLDLKFVNYIQLGLQSWQNSLGQLPLIFSIVGIILTLYII
ncbi:hypothetical protein HG535_0B03850 [Zygotorulaspora mrakii]|uniref:Uncharacterized protein n=1 Tax=Zygotorulaspora mrakii TaxID=42260 RepID=A0A7H9AY68_ZYGMR|nr:uncharacterized protein HG535_0B03850 [Zygotorulaspora mrakii]QLG71345.1 hypothetical protein HG535_0B03850 [Zygotorulaspora mrakii]